MPSISVISPVYNGAAFLAEAARCLSAQTYQDIEWVLVDDGSSDDSVAVARRVTAGLPFAVVLVELGRNFGAARARNGGLARASGRYVKFLDIDDVIEPDHLRIQVECLRERGVDFVTSPTEFLLEASGASVVFVDDSFDLDPGGPGGIARFVAASSYTHCGCLFEREALLEIGGYDESLVTDEDGWLILSLLLAGKRPSPTTATRYTYRVAYEAVGVNLSADNTLPKIESRIAVCRRIEAVARERDDRGLLAAVASRMAALALEVGHTDYASGRELFADARRLSDDFPDVPYPRVLRVCLLTDYRIGLAVFQAFKHLRRLKYRLSGLQRRLRGPRG